MLQLLIRLVPHMINPADVDFLVFRHPAKSVSVHTSIFFGSDWYGYISLNLEAPMRYLAVLLSLCMLDVVGFAISLLSS